ncbi:transcriptional regulator [Streptomyces misionensis]|uniref:Transcriptional regulator n=1 Tax=Streptomyces misionensis TaxID=67331 RepID=A0A5C6J387_9ACTN|nr:transcriptional regulator [Streptomyces misionensis]
MDWPTRGQRLNPEQRKRAGKWLKPQYEGGASIRELAEKIGRSYGFVHRNLELAGTTFRSRGGNRANRLPNSRTEDGVS